MDTRGRDKVRPRRRRGSASDHTPTPMLVFHPGLPNLRTYFNIVPRREARVQDTHITSTGTECLSSALNAQCRTTVRLTSGRRIYELPRGLPVVG